MKPLLIGQAPGRSTDPREPLSGRCGKRLAEFCGLSLGDFLDRFERVNLLKRFPGKAGKGDRFPAGAARRSAIKMERWLKPDRCVVLLGGNVAEAFAMGELRVRPALTWTFEDGVWWALCPHPSGINRWFNLPTNHAAAIRFWRQLAEEFS